MKTILIYIMIFFGFPYLLNRNTQEIHDLRKITKLCLISAMKWGNMIFACNKAMDHYLADGYNGCAHCLLKHNTG